MKKLAIFDLDGTLLNTIADLAACCNHTLKQFGFPTHPESSYHAFVGNGINKLIERALPESAREEKLILEMRESFIPYYNTHNKDYTTPYPGIVQLLERLNKDKIKLAIASNKYQEGTEKLVSFYFPHIDFEAVLGQRQGVPIKPDPTIVEEILHITGSLKEETIYIGDSPIDIQTAVNANIEVIGVSWGFRSLEELLPFSPTHTATTTAQIEEIIVR